MSEQLITGVDQLVENASLLSIEVFKLSAERKPDDHAGADEVEVDPRYSIGADFSDDEQRFRIRFLTSIKTPLGDIDCGVYAEYGLPGLVLGPESSGAVTEFVNNVAIMHMLPYVRQTIADVTQRVFNAPLLMPMVQRGQLTFELEISGQTGTSA